MANEESVSNNDLSGHEGQLNLDESKSALGAMPDNEEQSEEIEQSFSDSEESGKEENDDSGEDKLTDDEHQNKDADFKKLSRQRERKLTKELKRISQIAEQQQQFIEQFLSSQQQSPTGQAATTQEPTDPVEQKVNEVLAKKMAEERQKKEREELARHHLELAQELQSASDKYEDFEDVVRDKDVIFTQVMAEALHYLPKGIDRGEFVYQLAKNHDELKRISNLSPRQQAQAILSHAFNSKVTQQTVSKAPAPLRNNLASERKAVAPSPEDMDFDQLRLYLRDKKPQM